MTAIAHNTSTQAPSAAAFFDNLYDTATALENAALHLLNRRAALPAGDPQLQDIDKLRDLLDQAHELIANATGLAITRLT
ncbi:hypothetical protein [Mycobacteroides abscessus]|uniref:hypothetical protein n=1 Tax=Mycobacteroides abscessus TaxID=36809 RepID=UPI0009A569BC|nr:hypothetical protein [Mycobacteroides abscessus]SKO15287.1 Uncharacterised protein [Mycobacteroides abscessus subsp. bolletii]SKX37388.1 Uncharacterised protein [Mycobacteroides abscessus subsp. bolletii]